MSLLKMSCPSCGAPIQVPPDVDQLTCVYCGASSEVQRGEGYASLKLAEQVGQVIAETGRGTQSAIGDSAESTQAELRRIGIQQKITALDLQLSGIQSEIRALQRQKRTGSIKRQLKELREREYGLIQNLSRLTRILHPPPPQALGPAPSTEKKRNPQIALVGIALLMLSSIVCLCAGEPNVLVIIGIVVGAGLLVYALFTGNIKLLG